MAVHDQDLLHKINLFMRKLELGKNPSQFQAATETISILRTIISKTRWSTASDLLTIVRVEGRKLVAANESETAVGNMVRRVLRVIREDYTRMKKGETQQQIRQRLGPDQDEDYKKSIPNLKTSVIEGVSELLSEVESSGEIIVSAACESIKEGDVIMTIGKSSLVEAYLKKAAETRGFTVFVVECAPVFTGHQMAKNLSGAGITTKLITDASAMAFMPRMNRVIISAHTVMADGGLKAKSGAYMIVTAADFHKVPVVALAPNFKFCPEHNQSKDAEEMGNPDDTMSYNDMDRSQDVEIYNSLYDVITPDLIATIITDNGSHTPSFVRELQKELYYPQDWDLSK